MTRSRVSAVTGAVCVMRLLADRRGSIAIWVAVAAPSLLSASLLAALLWLAIAWWCAMRRRTATASPLRLIRQSQNAEPVIRSAKTTPMMRSWSIGGPCPDDMEVMMMRVETKGEAERPAHPSAILLQESVLRMIVRMTKVPQVSSRIAKPISLCPAGSRNSGMM